MIARRSAANAAELTRLRPGGGRASTDARAMATTGLPLSSAERARDDARRAAAALLVQQAAYNPEILPRISQYCGSSYVRFDSPVDRVDQ